MKVLLAAGASAKCLTTPSALQVGCGADELIDLVMRCCLDPGDKIVDSPPTFTMYAFDAAVNNASVVTVPRLPGFQVDVQGRAPHFAFPFTPSLLACKGIFWADSLCCPQSPRMNLQPALHVQESRRRCWRVGPRWCS